MGLRRQDLLGEIFQLGDKTKRSSKYTNEQLRLKLLREQVLVNIEIAEKLDSIAVELLRAVDAMNSLLERLDSR